MPIAFNSGGSRVMTDVWFHATAWRRILNAYRNVGGTWQLVHSIATAPPLAVTASPAVINLNVNSTAAAGSFSQTFTASVSGGTGGHTGSWVQVAGGPDATTYSGDATLALTLSGSWFRHATREYSETWRYTATDSVGATSYFEITLYVNVGDNT